jgi:hypothetical protein
VDVRYEHALEERDALLAQALNPYANGGKVVPIGIEFDSDRVRSAHDGDGSAGEVVALPPLTGGNDEECSGGETRTLNLAGAPEETEYQHPVE